MRKIIILLMGVLVLPVFAQDFFESLGEEEGSTPYELNGFMRGAFFAGTSVESDKPEQKSGYGEIGLKMRVRKGTWGDGYAELRFRRGYEFGQSISEMSVREAYVNTYLGNLDLRIGQQIVVWGRADGFNPTNNITPQNMLVRSSDEDDRRIGNFLFRANYNLRPFNLEFIWVPQYRPSVLPTTLFPFPDFVEFAGVTTPGPELDNGSIAAKLDLALSKVDGSLSYFKGYMPLPGIFPQTIGFDTESGGLQAVIVNRPYEMQVFGGDFSTALGSFGLRGEIAYRLPIKDYLDDALPHVPNPDMQYVFGMDKTIGDFSIIVQYIGRYIFDFEEFVPTGLYKELAPLYLTNRMIVSQLYETSHAVFMRPALALLHETLDLECAAYYDFTTEEALLRPTLTRDITDALTLKVGGDIYMGPDNTLFGSVEKALSSGFVELRVSF